MRLIEENTSDRRCDTYIFDSVDEMIEKAASEGRHTGDVTRKDFIFGQLEVNDRIGFESLADVMTSVRTAWPEGLAILDRMLEDLRHAALPTPKSRKRKMRWSSESGDELDLDRLRAGQDYWRTTRREMQTGPSTMTVLVDVGANCNVAAEDILWRGAAAVALTQILEAAGYRVELWSVIRSRELFNSDTTDGVVGCCLKRTEDPLDVSTLINAVSGWFFRTVGFLSLTLGNKSYDACLGQCQVPRKPDVDNLTADERRVMVYGAFDYNSAVALIKQVLDSLSMNQLN